MEQKSSHDWYRAKTKPKLKKRKNNETLEKQTDEKKKKTHTKEVHTFAF